MIQRKIIDFYGNSEVFKSLRAIMIMSVKKLAPQNFVFALFGKLMNQLTFCSNGNFWSISMILP